MSASPFPKKRKVTLSSDAAVSIEDVKTMTPVLPTALVPFSVGVSSSASASSLAVATITATKHNSADEKILPLDESEYVSRCHSKFWKSVMKDGWSSKEQQERFRKHCSVTGDILGKIQYWNTARHTLSDNSRTSLMNEIRWKLAEVFVLKDYEETFAVVHAQLVTQGRKAEAAAFVKKANNGWETFEVTHASYLQYREWMDGKPCGVAIVSTSTTSAVDNQHTALVKQQSTFERLAVLCRTKRATRKSSPIQLPVLIYLQFVHHLYGMLLIVGELWCIQQKPPTVSFVNGDYRNAKTNQPWKWAHVIRSISTPYLPLDLLIGRTFTSFKTSATLFDCVDGWNQWKLLENPEMTMATLARLKTPQLLNNPLLQHPVQYPGTQIKQAYPMQLLIISARFDCNELTCPEGQQCCHYVDRTHGSDDEDDDEGWNGVFVDDTKQDEESDLSGYHAKAESDALLRLDPEFICELHVRLNQLRVILGWNAIQPFTTGPGDVTHILPVDYINNRASIITLLEHFELSAVNGLSRQDLVAYPIADNVDVSQRLFLVSFRLTGKWPEYDKHYATFSRHQLGIIMPVELIRVAARASRFSSVNKSSHLNSFRQQLEQLGDTRGLLDYLQKIESAFNKHIRDGTSAQVSRSRAQTTEIVFNSDGTYTKDAIKEKQLDLLGEYRDFQGAMGHVRFFADLRYIIGRRLAFTSQRNDELIRNLKQLINLDYDDEDDLFLKNEWVDYLNNVNDLDAATIARITKEAVYSAQYGELSGR